MRDHRIEIPTSEKSQQSFTCFRAVQTYLNGIVDQSVELDDEQITKLMDAKTFLEKDVTGVSRLCPEYNKSVAMYKCALDVHQKESTVNLFYEDLLFQK